MYFYYLELMNQRNEYVLNNLSEASSKLREATELTAKYEAELLTTKKAAQKEINEIQKLQKESLDAEVELSQDYLDTLIQKILENFGTKKQMVLGNLEPEINSLSSQMVKILFTN